MRGGPFGGGPPAPTEHPLSFSLEELYKGCTKRLKVSRTITEPSGNSMRVQEPLEVNAKPGHKKGTKFTFAEKGEPMLPPAIPIFQPLEASSSMTSCPGSLWRNVWHASHAHIECFQGSAWIEEQFCWTSSWLSST